MKRWTYILAVIILAALACGLPQGLGDPETLATSVYETLQAAGVEAGAIATTVAQTLEASAGDLPPVDEPLANPDNPFQTGIAEVTLCYPSEMIPPMTLYLENVNTQEVTVVPTVQNQPPMELPLPPGTYVAYAWLPDFAFGGSYSQAVPCGLSVECNDHSLIQFEIMTDQTTSRIEVCDWYGDPGDVPYPPNVDASQLVGAISGNLGYPSSFIPAMTVVATNVDTQQYYYVQTQQNQTTYIIENLPPGMYTVMAYPGTDEQGGGYSMAVLCGLSVECNDHALVPVSVTAGQTVQNADPKDFYADPGTFPPNPAN